MAAQMEKQNQNQMANNQMEDKNQMATWTPWTMDYKTNNTSLDYKTNNTSMDYKTNNTPLDYKTNNTSMDYETNTWHTAYRYTAKKKAH